MHIIFIVMLSRSIIYSGGRRRFLSNKVHHFDIMQSNSEAQPYSTMRKLELKSSCNNLVEVSELMICTLIILQVWQWLLADIDECASPQLNSCAQSATCSNTPGAYNCSCNARFQGDGFVNGSRCTASATLTRATYASKLAILVGRIAHQQLTVTYNLIANVCKFIYQS